MRTFLEYLAILLGGWLLIIGTFVLLFGSEFLCKIFH